MFISKGVTTFFLFFTCRHGPLQQQFCVNEQPYAAPYEVGFIAVKTVKTGKIIS